jgi:hypothetical protein
VRVANEPKFLRPRAGLKPISRKAP